LGFGWGGVVHSLENFPGGCRVFLILFPIVFFFPLFGFLAQCDYYSATTPPKSFFSGYLGFSPFHPWTLLYALFEFFPLEFFLEGIVFLPFPNLRPDLIRFSQLLKFPYPSNQ